MEGSSTLIDKIIVASYFVIVTVIGISYSRRYRKDSTKDDDRPGNYGICHLWIPLGVLRHSMERS
jgi:hypothetical protein